MSDHNIVNLYIVSTPIGNLSDMSARAVEVLKRVTLIATEDTRHSRHLLQYFSIDSPIISLHKYNEQQRRKNILDHLQKGESVALISDAGTPLISDPGYHLVSLAREHGINIIPVPGSCSLIAALSASGLRSDRFAFEGFLSSKQNSRIETLKKLSDESRTLIFYESSRRLQIMLTNMKDIFGGQRKACIARELTKLHETIVTKLLSDLLSWVSSDQYRRDGECVVLVEGANQQLDAGDIEINRTLTLLLKELSIKKQQRLPLLC